MSTVVSIQCPSVRFPEKPDYKGMIIDLVFVDKVVTLAGHVKYPDSFALLKKIQATSEMFLKYRAQPSDEKINEIFEQVLDEMMLKEDKRTYMRQLEPKKKWDLIRDQQKMNIQSNFVILNCIELLKRVSGDLLL